MHSRIMGCKSLYWGDLGYKNDFSQHDTLNTYEHFEIDRILNWCELQLINPREASISPHQLDKSIFASTPTTESVLKKINCWSSMVLNMRNKSI